jgi:hypothetical protein
MRWLHNETGTEMLMMIADSYGEEVAFPGETTPHPKRRYINPHTPHEHDHFAIDGWDQAMVFMYTSDNRAPPNAREVTDYWKRVQVQFPNARLHAGSMDDFVDKLWAASRPSTDASAGSEAAAVATSEVATAAEATTLLELPTYDGEIGDGWLNGGGSDPYRNAAFRSIRRVRNRRVLDGSLAANNTRLQEFEFRLLVHPEHNWGNSGLNKWEQIGRTPTFSTKGKKNWTNTDFHAVRGRLDYEYFAGSWREGREYLSPLPAAQSQSPSDAAQFDAYWAEAKAEIDSLTRRFIHKDALLKDGYTRISPADTTSDSGNIHRVCTGASVKLVFDNSSGALIGLQDSTTGKEWVTMQSAGSNSTVLHGLGAYSYRTYDETDFVYMSAPNDIEPPVQKKGMDKEAHPVSRIWLPMLEHGNMYQRIVAGSDGSHGSHGSDGETGATASCSYVSNLQMPPHAHEYYGAAQQLWLNVTVAREQAQDQQDQLVLWVEVQQLNKTATRLAEASFMSFTPLVPKPNAVRTAISGKAADGWAMDVLGSPVSPLTVAANGTRHLHAVWDGVSYDDAEHNVSVAIRTLDAPLVCPGDAEHMLRYVDGTQPDMRGGWHFNLHNNHWAVAFPVWYPFAKDSSDANQRVRFEVRLSAGKCSSSGTAC